MEIDECASGAHDCFTADGCINTAGGFLCKCPSGFVPLGTRQEDGPLAYRTEWFPRLRTLGFRDARLWLWRELWCGCGD